MLWHPPLSSKRQWCICPIPKWDNILCSQESLSIDSPGKGSLRVCHHCSVCTRQENGEGPLLIPWIPRGGKQIAECTGRAWWILVAWCPSLRDAAIGHVPHCCVFCFGASMTSARASDYEEGAQQKWEGGWATVFSRGKAAVVSLHSWGMDYILGPWGSCLKTCVS